MRNVRERGVPSSRSSNEAASVSEVEAFFVVVREGRSGRMGPEGSENRR
jgi:hypothetical protein